VRLGERVADQEVGAAGVAQCADLGEQAGDGDGGVLGPASAQVLAVGVDQGGAVLRGPDEPVGFGVAGVALDGVECEVEASGAFEQAHALLAQVVDLLPALAGGLRASALADRRPQGRPAGAVRQDFLEGRPAEQVPQMPAVRDLHGAGCRVGDGLGEAAGPVPAHGLEPRVLAQPTGDRFLGAVCEHVDAGAGGGVDDERGVAVAAAQGELVDAQYVRDGLHRHGDAHQAVQDGRPGQRAVQYGQQPGPGRSRQCHGHRVHYALQGRVRRW
jgi:hypothetical protein